MYANVLEEHAASIFGAEVKSGGYVTFYAVVSLKKCICDFVVSFM
jgi:hypothetical protein